MILEGSGLQLPKIGGSQTVFPVSRFKVIAHMFHFYPNFIYFGGLWPSELGCGQKV